jgi:hypothetical protein
MAKQRGYPDRRGMGAQSDFISDSFIPNEKQRAELMERARILIAAGMAPERVAAMLSIPIDALLEEGIV